MKQLTLKAIKQVNGHIRLPGSKSISNRALLLAALSSGKTTVSNLLFSDDVRFMLEALNALGVSLAINEADHEVTVEGLAGRFDVSEPKHLFLGNAGTAMRPLCAALAFSSGEFELTGEPRMKERPIEHLVDALRDLGASIDYLETEGYPPLYIRGRSVDNNTVTIDGSLSSQYITALLLASPLLPSGLTLDVVGELVSRPYIDITIGMMKTFGVDVDEPKTNCYVIKSGQTYHSPGRYWVEGDASSASYFLAAAAINGGEITVEGVGKKSVQGDIGFADVLEQMGADIHWEDESITCRRGALHGVSMDMNHIPDAAMTIATTALFADSPSTISNVYNWRIKETDRLHAMATELKKLGAKVEEGKDYLTVWPLETPAFVEIDTYDDHRVAMCFSLVAVGGHDIIINDPDCTHKTFPTYFELLEAVAER